MGDCVRRILQVLLTNEMAMTFNWIGSRGDKMAFKDTSLMHLVYGMFVSLMIICIQIVIAYFLN